MDIEEQEKNKLVQKDVLLVLLFIIFRIQKVWWIDSWENRFKKQN